MKIYKLPIDNELQPATQSIEYPIGNDDYGVEQDFYNFVLKSNTITDNPDEADWHYLPIYWTRWHLNHDYGRRGLPELRKYVKKAILNDSKTFTICQYADGPMVDLGKTAIFYTSRKSQQGFDIPLLRNRLKIPFIKPRKQFLASFVGRFDTHPIRKRMFNTLKNNEDILLIEGNEGQDYFVKTLLSSYVALCPRGHGGGSFRFYEAMQLGVVPMLIGDIDVRPFKNFINWGECSLYVKDAKEISAALTSKSKKELARMGKTASKVYGNNLTYGTWCNYVIKQLETFS